MKKTALHLILFFSITTFSQFSKTHYIPPLSNSDNQEPQGQFMYISCPSITPISFRIIQIGGTTINGTVSRDFPYRLDIGMGFNTQLLISRSDVSSIKNNKGYIVEAEDLVYVTVRLTSTVDNYQAGGLVSKGLAALGTQFRIGAFINTGAPSTTQDHYTFASILATENNTTISFNDIKPGVSLINNTIAGNTPSSIILNSGESYAIAVEGPNIANKDGLIGASITSDKPIAVNCGSFAGSNGSTSNLDLGFDQIVSAERTGKDYIFIKGSGINVTERPLIVANENATDIFLNGSTTPFATLNAGQYLALNGANFSANGNLYVNTSKNVFAYQGIGGSSSQANQNMDFVPPLSCQTPKIINNIPFINEVGTNVDPRNGSQLFFEGTVCIVTETGASLNFILNGTSYTYATLPSSIIASGPLSVTGNLNYVTYTFKGLTGNISVISSKQVYLSYYGSSGSATYGGFYSGFTFRPEVSFHSLNSTQSNCIPNVELKINSLSSFDEFQWYYKSTDNGTYTAILGANSGNYFPSIPGYYYVSSTISECGSMLNSDVIPVSDCTPNNDADFASDNIDLDLDNDGISNCLESLGNLNLDLSNPNTGNVIINSYNNSYLGSIATGGISLPSPTPFVGNTDGSFVTEVSSGIGNSTTFQMNFNQPISLNLEYVTIANSTDLINSNSKFIIKTSSNKTITVLNPTNQLLIDTNYDGIFESGITHYSSFEIRFKVNSNIPLAAGTGTFKFSCHLTNYISISQVNLADFNSNKSTFKLTATCVPVDSDLDGIADQLDSDSDNDGILDNVEFMSQNYIAYSNIDANLNGMDDIYEPLNIPSDFDLDTIPDYLDLDSDNDGIKDSIETSINTDSTELANYVDLDSDNDGCSDVTDAGFLDGDNDSYIGNSPMLVDINGLVIGASYAIPNSNYIFAAPISLLSQPIDVTKCELENATFTISSTPVDTYQWQVSNDGINWRNILDSPLTNTPCYSGSTSFSLIITRVIPSMNGNKYRVLLSKNGNSCGLTSSSATLITFALPVINDSTIIQCDDNLDAITLFNLTVNNPQISSNYTNEVFTYYTSFAGANATVPYDVITNETAFQNTTPSLIDVWTRVTNSNGCYRIAKLTLKVLATSIPSTFNISIPKTCDDFLDLYGFNTINNNNRDGVSSFNISSTETTIRALLPSTGIYNIKYYRNQADALAETNRITDLVNYRNIGYPTTQNIWVRVDSDITNACYGLGPYVTVNVEALPFAHPVIIPRQCDDNQDGIFNFNTTSLENDLLQGQTTGVTVTYFDAANNPLRDSNSNLITSRFPTSFSTTSQTIKAVVKNNSTLACSDETFIEFIVDNSPVDFTIPSTLISVCDDEIDPAFQNGLYDFTNSQAIHNIVTLGQANGMVYEYYDENNVLLSTPMPNPLSVTLSKNIKIIVKNPINSTCSLTKTIQLLVNPTPKIDQEHSELVCSNLSTFFVVLTAGIVDGTSESNYTYKWYKDTVIIATETSSSLNVNSEGIYTVEVINTNGCSSTRTITVTASDVAHIGIATIVDLSFFNSVTINVTNPGQYLYSMDYPNLFQQSNLFENVPAGIHEIFVKDLNGCGISQQTIFQLTITSTT